MGIRSSVVSLTLIVLEKEAKVAMETIDRVFQVVFARYRRKMGDSNLKSAWRLATNKISGYFIFPVAAAAFVLIAIARVFMGTETSVGNRDTVQIVACIIGVIAGYILDRRFRKYLAVPPALVSPEPHADARLVFWFRMISIGILVLAGVGGFIVRRTNPNWLQGF